MTWENSHMQALIPIINQVQDAFTQLGTSVNFELPQIAVVGGQSAGKSSVLENFVGKDFLPRGSGIVTRRPLYLQLMNDRNEYAEFLHKKGHRFVDFDAVRKEIEDETDRVTGPKKGISDHPIHLRIHSPHVLNLTLIDLPGLTKIPVGDQPPDIEHQIRKMIMTYISRESCLILAVTPANADLATSDALKLAKEVDPQGLRTIGVLTKLDLMDEGTDARDILENRLFTLRRGYVGVVNRGQKDINSRKDIKTQLDEERKFFLAHPAYRHMEDRLGTQHLQRELNRQLMTHIRKTLPVLKASLQEKMASMEKDLAEFKNFQPNDPDGKTKALMQLVHEFTGSIEQSIDGYKNAKMDELSGGTRIKQLFNERFPYELSKISVNDEDLRRKISIIISNLHGIRNGIFTPDAAFHIVAKDQVSRLKEPSLKCVDLAVAELEGVVNKCAETMVRFPRLRDEIERIVTSKIRECEVNSKEWIGTLIDLQLAHINVEEFQGLSNVEDKVVQGLNGKMNPTNQVIRKGWISILNLSFVRGSKDHWFVLTTESLTWYKDEEEKERQYILPLDGIKLRDLDSGFLSKQQKFALFYPDGRNIHKDWKQLELACPNADETDAWKAALLRAGIYKMRESTGANGDASLMDPTMERQVETIRQLVDSFTRVATKSIKEFVPKSVGHQIVQQVSDFVKQELLMNLFLIDKDTLMEESAAEAQKREAKLGMYHACKEALRIISEVNMSNLDVHSSSSTFLPGRPAPLPPRATGSPPLIPARPPASSFPPPIPDRIGDLGMQSLGQEIDQF